MHLNGKWKECSWTCFSAGSQNFHCPWFHCRVFPTSGSSELAIPLDSIPLPLCSYGGRIEPSFPWKRSLLPADGYIIPVLASGAFLSPDSHLHLWYSEECPWKLQKWLCHCSWHVTDTDWLPWHGAFGYSGYGESGWCLPGWVWFWRWPFSCVAGGDTVTSETSAEWHLLYELDPGKFFSTADMYISVSNLLALIAVVSLTLASNTSSEILVFPLNCFFLRYWTYIFILALSVWAASSDWLSLKVLISRQYPHLADYFSTIFPHFWLTILHPNSLIQIFICLNYGKLIALPIYPSRSCLEDCFPSLLFWTCQLSLSTLPSASLLSYSAIPFLSLASSLIYCQNIRACPSRIASHPFSHHHSLVPFCYKHLRVVCAGRSSSQSSKMFLSCSWKLSEQSFLFWHL